MSLFGEFHVPADEFIFHDALDMEPATVIEIERVVATDELLTPYFWVSNVSGETFESAVADDPTVDKVEELDDFDDATLYRAEWIDRVETLVYAYTHVGAAILSAEGKHDEWILRMRFDDREKLDQFNAFLRDEDVSFELRQLYETKRPRSSGQFGLTPKQYETLTMAWEMGYFDLPRAVTMEEVADELGIAPQSLSDRLRRAQDALIEEALRVEVSSDGSPSGVSGT